MLATFFNRSIINSIKLASLKFISGFKLGCYAMLPLKVDISLVVYSEIDLVEELGSVSCKNNDGGGGISLDDSGTISDNSSFFFSFTVISCGSLKNY